jgi:hypothetical protein
MRKLTATLATLIFALVALIACTRSSSKFGLRPGYTGPAQIDRFTYVSGTSGTYVVPVGYAVVEWWAHNTTSGGTVTIAPSGPREYSACSTWDAGPDPYDAAADTGPDTFDAAAPSTCRDAGPSIVIPAATGFGLQIPTLTGSPDELGEGTVFVFTGTDSYVITLHNGN